MSRKKVTTTFDAEPNRSVSFGEYSLGDTASVVVDSANPFKVSKKDNLTFSEISVTENAPYGDTPYEIEITFSGTPALGEVNAGEILELQCPDFENTGFTEITSVDSGNNKITAKGYAGNINNTYTPDDTYAQTFPLLGGYFIECEEDDPSIQITDESGTRTIGMFAGQVKQADRIIKLIVPNGSVKLYLL